MNKISGGLKKGEGAYGTAVSYALYVNYGTRFQSAQPYMSASIAVVRLKAAKTYEKEMGKAIARGLRKQYKKRIAEGVEFYGTDLEIPIDDGIETSLEILLAAGVTDAKARCPHITSNLLRSIMWKTTNKEDGYGRNS